MIEIGHETELGMLTKEEIIQRYLELAEEYRKQEKELNRYKNPNTPPSANKHLKPDTRGSNAKAGAKRGAPNGHKGTTRIQHPTRKAIVDAASCPNCNSENLEDRKIIKQTVEEIPQADPPETVESEIHLKECLDCGLVFVPPQNTTPLKGKFGINLMVLVIFIRFILRGVLRKTVSFLETGFAFTITPASVNAIIKRVAEAAEGEYEALKAKVRASDTIYVDETSFSVLGKNWWVWIFRTPTDMLLVIRPSRGSNVLEEILGKGYSGTVICDCWSAYNFLSNALLQRCWSHLLRKSKDLCATISGKNFHSKLKALFREIKDFNASDPTQAERDEKYLSMIGRLKSLVEYYSKYPELAGVLKYISRRYEEWLTCVKVEGIEPTNNFAEQGIRETVVVRKIIGAFRSETGTKNYETLASLLATWQMQGLDVKEQLRSMLIKNLCFC